MRLLALAVGLSLLAPVSRAALQRAVELALEAEDAVDDLDAPFRPAVVFRIGAAAAWPGDEAPSLAGVRRWQIQIFDFDDRKVHFIQGEGAPSSDRVEWNGAARDGTPLRDGFYTARLAWVDAAGAPRRSEPVKVGLLTPPGINDFAGPKVQVLHTNAGMVIRLSEDLTFDAGRWELRPQSAAALEKIAAFLARHPRHRLSVVGHADSTGSAAANRLVSLRRALSIRAFLESHGIDPERVTSEGRGADEPLASNDTPEGREKNRRVEIVLLRATI